MTGLVWLALDGLGYPGDAPDGSVWEAALPTLRPLIEAGRALDATLGVPGLPQSGTGQACWLTGLDAVRAMGEPGKGEHFGPHPGPTLQRLLRAEALPARLAQAGARLALANHYPPAYFAAQVGGQTGGQTGGQSGRTGAQRPRLGCFPFSFLAAGLPLNPPGVPPVPATLGLGYADPWPEQTPLTEVTRLGTALALAARTHDLIVCDLWFGDHLGHRGRTPTPPPVLRAGRAYLERVDALLTGLLDAGARVVLSSDHGNLEDLRVKAHTLARVPFAGVGLALGTPRTVVEGGQAIAAAFGLKLDLGSDAKK
ncbi:metalloprotein [Deinococcus phoenicis]|uniref:Metalloprotein n=1 Tax=Deinococcus phoenicis TaxID=1476583 RepID=A0A016QSN9_9DEIO|nr:metalloenzyme domain protein [Deinococcus phoenicis]EYB69016.1 metalloprotein [Deinococcus phoenicis]